ncbi:flagellar hook-length control protein FliK [Pseudomonas sp. TTU2014-080ASC]|uniref:flagellar hook-length control protein FliK n=1 Tax=Pseudomonas sp. TTU2014-080ASC TaxID=1729724 RepID=UPI0007184EEB|nr:flagellar hook-length control protein FliK [Pseudomonas sp. TTU2014-080ASC]KRW59488.1 flagellar hook-length control protein FliK [Pseudomonas sp. TTU2014-080ASC]
MSEISSSRPLPPANTVNRPATPASDLTVRLQQPMEDLLVAGETAKAEVIAQKALAQNFQLLLRLTLDNGRQALLEANSSRPLEQGSTLAVTALSQTRLALSALTGSSNKPMTSLDLEQLPVGTLIQGKVVSREQLPGTTTYRVIVNLLNTSLAGSQLAIDSDTALPIGSLLSARVQSNQSLGFIPLSGRLDQLALSQQLGGQLSRQGSLEGLFTALQGLRAGGGLPDGLAGALEKLFASLPDAAQLSTAKGLAKALENSGVFLEGKLLGGQTQGLSADLKANLLRLISQMMPGALPGTAPGAAASSSALAQALPAMARDLLQTLNKAGTRQLGLSFPLPTRLMKNEEGEDDLEATLKLAAAAIARLQTHQLSSLTQSQTGPDGNLLTTWQLEIPMRNQHEVVPLQVKLQREDSSDKKKEKQETLWRVELAFDVEPLGPMQVQAQLAHGLLASQLWAEREQTARLIDGELNHLRQRLNEAGLNVSELVCNRGIPPQGPRTTLEQRWVDETA